MARISRRRTFCQARANSASGCWEIHTLKCFTTRAAIASLRRHSRVFATLRLCGKRYRSCTTTPTMRSTFLSILIPGRGIPMSKKSFSAACREASITDFTFHDLRHTIGTRLADAGVDVVKIKELMGHASIVTTMRYIHATDQGKSSAITVLSEYRQQHCRRLSQTKSGRFYNLPQFIDLIGAPGMIRTCDPLIRSQVLYPTELRVPLKANFEYKGGFWGCQASEFRRVRNLWVGRYFPGVRRPVGALACVPQL